MTQVGHILRITACAEILSQEVCNVFYYLVAVWTGNASLDDIFDPFKTDLIDKVCALQSTSFTWTNFRIDNLSDGLGFAEYGLTKPGQLAGHFNSPSYVASGWKLNRATKLTRAGFKRFAGVCEDQHENNHYEPNDAPAVAALEAALAADLAIDTPNPGDGVLSPVIVGRTASGGYDLNRVSPIISASKQYYITTQTSRKQGRGQ